MSLLGNLHLIWKEKRRLTAVDSCLKLLWLCVLQSNPQLQRTKQTIASVNRFTTLFCCARHTDWLTGNTLIDFLIECLCAVSTQVASLAGRPMQPLNWKPSWNLYLPWNELEVPETIHIQTFCPHVQAFFLNTPCNLFVVHPHANMRSLSHNKKCLKGNLWIVRRYTPRFAPTVFHHVCSEVLLVLYGGSSNYSPLGRNVPWTCQKLRTGHIGFPTTNGCELSSHLPQGSDHTINLQVLSGTCLSRASRRLTSHTNCMVVFCNRMYTHRKQRVKHSKDMIIFFLCAQFAKSETQQRYDYLSEITYFTGMYKRLNSLLVSIIPVGNHYLVVGRASITIGEKKVDKTQIVVERGGGHLSKCASRMHNQHLVQVPKRGEIKSNSFFICHGKLMKHRVDLLRGVVLTSDGSGRVRLGSNTRKLAANRVTYQILCGVKEVSTSWHRLLKVTFKEAAPFTEVDWSLALKCWLLRALRFLFRVVFSDHMLTRLKVLDSNACVPSFHTNSIRTWHQM